MRLLYVPGDVTDGWMGGMHSQETVAIIKDSFLPWQLQNTALVVRVTLYSVHRNNIEPRVSILFLVVQERIHLH